MYVWCRWAPRGKVSQATSRTTATLCWAAAKRKLRSLSFPPSSYPLIRSLTFFLCYVHTIHSATTLGCPPRATVTGRGLPTCRTKILAQKADVLPITSRVLPWFVRTMAATRNTPTTLTLWIVRARSVAVVVVVPSANCRFFSKRRMRCRTRRLSCSAATLLSRWSTTLVSVGSLG